VRLREVPHAFPAQLAADAGLGEPTERRALVDRGRVVTVEEGDLSPPRIRPAIGA